MEKQVICIDEQDKETGSMGKAQAHEEGVLHRAFSIFVFNDKGQLLLQQRALDKYHSGGLWTNTCCSHPQPGEDIMKAAHARLQEEMGFDCALEEIFQFTYRAEFDNGLIEHELDHVLIGKFNGMPVINEEEAEAFRWIGLEELQKDMKEQEELYTEWFKIAMVRVLDYKKQQEQKNANLTQGISIGICLGAGIGWVFGKYVFDNPSIGMLFGISIGTALGVSLGTSFGGRK